MIEKNHPELSVRRQSTLLEVTRNRLTSPAKVSIPDKGHRKYPYLLRDLTVDRPDQVWCTDI